MLITNRQLAVFYLWEEQLDHTWYSDEAGLGKWFSQGTAGQATEAWGLVFIDPRRRLVAAFADIANAPDDFRRQLARS